MIQPSPALLMACWIAEAFLALGMLLCLVRLIRGPSPADQVLALDLLAFLVIGMNGVNAIIAGDPLYLEVNLGLSLVVFLGTVAVARLLERSARG